MSQLNPSLRKQICRLFAELYSDQTSISRIVRWSALELPQVTVDGKALNTWDSVIDEAIKTNRLDNLWNTILEEYGANATLQEIYRTYQVTTSVSDSFYIRDLPPATQPTRLTLARNIDTFSRQEQDSIMISLSHLLSVGPVELSVAGLRPGSVILLLELPTEKIILLWVLYRSGYLANLGIERVSFAGADLRGIDLRRVDLRGADLEGVWLKDAIYDNQTRWPTGFNFQNSGAVATPINNHTLIQGLIDNKTHAKVVDALKLAMGPASQISILSGQFSIYAYIALKRELARTQEVRILLSQWDDSDAITIVDPNVKTRKS